MKKIAAALVAVFLLVSLFALAPVRQIAAAVNNFVSVQILQSKVDSTAIGSSIPSTGAFTTLSANAGGSLSGTFTGNPIFSGNPNFTGTPTFAGATFGGLINTNSLAVTANNATLNGGALNGTYTGDPIFSGNATFNNLIGGSVSGNAATATALAGTPNVCPSGAGWYQIQLGISPNGDAICGAIHEFVALSGGCVTNGSTNASCSNVLTWPHAFTSQVYVATCQGEGPSDPGRAVVNISSKDASTITVNTAATGNVAVSFNIIDCQADHQ